MSLISEGCIVLDIFLCRYCLEWHESVPCPAFCKIKANNQKSRHRQAKVLCLARSTSRQHCEKGISRENLRFTMFNDGWCRSVQSQLGNGAIISIFIHSSLHTKEKEDGFLFTVVGPFEDSLSLVQTERGSNIGCQGQG